MQKKITLTQRKVLTYWNVGTINWKVWKYSWWFQMWYLILEVGFSGEGNGTPLQYSCLENPMDGGAWWAAVHGVAKSRTQLSDFTFSLGFHALEKEMATHSSIFAWRIPGTGEPGGLPSMGLHRAGHNWSDFAAAATYKSESYSWLRITDYTVRTVGFC